MKISARKTQKNEGGGGEAKKEKEYNEGGGSQGKLLTKSPAKWVKSQRPKIHKGRKKTTGEKVGVWKPEKSATVRTKAQSETVDTKTVRGLGISHEPEFQRGGGGPAKKEWGGENKELWEKKPKKQYHTTYIGEGKKVRRVGGDPKLTFETLKKKRLLALQKPFVLCNTKEKHDFETA